ncbi:GntR family transcriptional regulator [Nesterenkonia aerolata]|uniref:GntR family transcriptional regulator n=1 Tax=Nesterenkonia aerolata TaxID=3074079 RepID=A0ABU2DNU8_9MICC|nr:GntR family transcriptional regulator [Nesterenkonia sp. LY-0111]MDR8018177.1 GntR family transcriptional regulator [Nesterenkonia sp. LY-0111]
MESVERHATLTEQITAQLRAAVLDGELVPGERYSAGGLAERFGVSRTPVREALLELERSGLVRIEKNRGVSVIPSSLEAVVDCFQLRLMLEAPAAGRAAAVVDERSAEGVESRFQVMEEAAARGDVDGVLRADRDFHLEVLALADNPQLVKVLEDLRNTVLQRGIATVPLSRSLEELVADHRDVLQGIRDRDPAAASAAMHRHILNTVTLLIRREAAADETCEEQILMDRLLALAPRR